MANFQDKTRAVLPPMLGGPGHLQPQRLAGTGTAEASTSRRLAKDHLHELVVGGTPGTNDVRVTFRAEGGLADQVATTDFVVPSGTVFPFLAVLGRGGAYGSLHVYVEAADGSSMYECFVQQRGM
jgi:hypothetical protein